MRDTLSTFGVMAKQNISQRVSAFNAAAAIAEPNTAGRPWVHYVTVAHSVWDALP